MTTTTEMTLCAARDGGLVVWLGGQSEPAFAGDLKAFQDYIGSRAQELLANAAREKKESGDVHQIERQKPMIREVLARRLEVQDAAE